MRAYGVGGIEYALKRTAGDLAPRSLLDPDGLPTTGVTITTTGQTFSPTVELTPGSDATVTWTVDGTVVATGASPSIDFGSATSRNVLMGVTDKVFDRLDHVVGINLGYDSGNDAGWYSLGSGYNHAVQDISAVTGLTACPNLRYFCAANTLAQARTGKLLSGPLDVSGLAHLEYVECFYANLDSINLTGCTSLIRVCLERNNLTTIDLNPVAANLKDLRCALQRGGVLTLTPLTAPLASLYHFCVRDQQVVNFPSPDKLPITAEMLVWNTEQSGALVVSSTHMQALDMYENSWTSLSCPGAFGAGINGSLIAHTNALTSVNIAGCVGLKDITFVGNALNQSAIDGILAEVDSWNTSNGSLSLGGAGNAAPSATGQTHKAALQSRGWTVSTA